jgi:glutamine synthetase
MATEEAGRQFNVEFRVADATACPYLALGALVQAGVDGIRRELALDPPPLPGFWDLTDEGRKEAGCRALPQSLDEALDQLAHSEAARAWFGSKFFDVYLQFKRAEARAVADLGDEAICARYAEAY